MPSTIEKLKGAELSLQLAQLEARVRKASPMCPHFNTRPSLKGVPISSSFVQAEKSAAKVKAATDRVNELKARVAARVAKKAGKAASGSGTSCPVAGKRTRYSYDRTRCVACQQWARVHKGELKHVSEKHKPSCEWGR